MSIVEFLLARITEDEEEARYAENYFPDDGPFVRWDSDRVLAECEAKRRIVELLRDHLPMSMWDEASLVAWAMLRLLALPYVDHPDYREEFRP